MPVRKYPIGMKCKDGGCDRQAMTRGFCHNHYACWYQKMRRKTDPVFREKYNRVRREEQSEKYWLDDKYREKRKKISREIMRERKIKEVKK